MLSRNSAASLIRKNEANRSKLAKEMLLQDRLDQDQAVALPVFGHQADAVAHGVVRVLDLDFAPFQS